METSTKEQKIKRVVSSIMTRNRKKFKENKVNSLEYKCKRAGEIFIERGTDSGRETDDWNKAENEIVFSYRTEVQYGKDTM
jgi:hypothetical protein